MIRRLIDVKGFHTGTDVDIKSKRIAKVLQESDPDVEGVSLTAVPLQVSIQMNWPDQDDTLSTVVIMIITRSNWSLGTSGVLLPQLVSNPAEA